MKIIETFLKECKIGWYLFIKTITVAQWSERLLCGW